MKKKFLGARYHYASVYEMRCSTAATNVSDKSGILMVYQGLRFGTCGHFTQKTATTDGFIKVAKPESLAADEATVVKVMVWADLAASVRPILPVGVIWNKN